MPAGYLALRDAEFDLTPTQEREFEFHLPTNVIRTGQRAPVLSFIVKPEPGIGPMKFDIDINDNPQRNNEPMGSDEKGVFWEIVNNDAARAGRNTIQFRVVDGLMGKVTFSDVIIWFQTP
jgi:hypothetical protein